jgi:hypothetical protein
MIYDPLLSFFTNSIFFSLLKLINLLQNYRDNNNIPNCKLNANNLRMCVFFNPQLKSLLKFQHFRQVTNLCHLFGAEKTREKSFYHFMQKKIIKNKLSKKYFNCLLISYVLKLQKHIKEIMFKAKCNFFSIPDNKTEKYEY